MPISTWKFGTNPLTVSADVAVFGAATTVTRSCALPGPVSVPVLTFWLAPGAGRTKLSGRIVGAAADGGADVGAPPKPIRLMPARSWPNVDPVNSTSAVAERHCGTTFPPATGTPSRSTSTPSVRSTTSQRADAPIVGVGSAFSGRPTTGTTGVFGAAATCTVAWGLVVSAGMSVAIRTRIVPGGRNVSIAAVFGCVAVTGSLVEPSSRSTGPGTRSMASSPDSPGASVSMVNRPSSPPGAAGSRLNGARARRVAEARPHSLSSTIRPLSWPVPRNACAQLFGLASRHSVGSGTWAPSKWSTSALSAPGGPAGRARPVAVDAVERCPNSSTDRTCTSVFRSVARPSSSVADSATSFSLVSEPVPQRTS